MEHGIVPHQDSEVAGLMAWLEAEAVAVIRHRCTHVADRERGNGSVETGNSPTIRTRHASKCHNWTWQALPSYTQTMLRLLRLALQLVLFFMLLAVVISIAAAETGPWEKAALLLLGAGLVWLASRVRAVTARPV
jgi:hypothetical protein